MASTRELLGAQPRKSASATPSVMALCGDTPETVARWPQEERSKIVPPRPWNRAEVRCLAASRGIEAEATFTRPEELQAVVPKVTRTKAWFYIRRCFSVADLTAVESKVSTKAGQLRLQPTEARPAPATHRRTRSHGLAQGVGL